ncbi:MAG: hypothetical protein ACREFQ_15610 [Stellaceae bacterium]
MPAIQRAIDIENKYGIIKETLKVSPRYVDLNPLKEADNRLSR